MGKISELIPGTPAHDRVKKLAVEEDIVTDNRVVIHPNISIATRKTLKTLGYMNDMTIGEVIDRIVDQYSGKIHIVKL